MGRSAKSKRQEKLERSFAEAGCDMSIAEEHESSPVQGLVPLFSLAGHRHTTSTCTSTAEASVASRDMAKISINT